MTQHDWSTIRSYKERGQSVELMAHFGPYAVGDTVILKDGTFEVVSTMEYKRSGKQVIELKLKRANA